MLFELPEQILDVADSLRAFEPQAPKPLKPVLLQAANELTHLKRAASECAQALELAATLRAGAMDSESKHLEVQREKDLTLTQIAAKLRRLADE